MNVQKLEEEITGRITALEDEELRLQEWLKCLRKVEGVVAEWQAEPQLKSATEVLAEDKSAAKTIESLDETSPQFPYSDAGFRSRLEQLRVQPEEVDPLDQLRQQLAAKSIRNSRLSLGSRLLFGARA